MKHEKDRDIYDMIMNDIDIITQFSCIALS